MLIKQCFEFYVPETDDVTAPCDTAFEVPSEDDIIEVPQEDNVIYVTRS